MAPGARPPGAGPAQRACAYPRRCARQARSARLLSSNTTSRRRSSAARCCPRSSSSRRFCWSIWSARSPRARRLALPSPSRLHCGGADQPGRVTTAELPGHSGTSLTGWERGRPREAAAASRKPSRIACHTHPQACLPSRYPPPDCELLRAGRGSHLGLLPGSDLAQALVCSRGMGKRLGHLPGKVHPGWQGPILSKHSVEMPAFTYHLGREEGAWAGCTMPMAARATPAQDPRQGPPLHGADSRWASAPNGPRQLRRIWV